MAETYFANTTCPQCGAKGQTPVDIPAILHKTEICEKCAVDTATALQTPPEKRLSVKEEMDLARKAGRVAYLYWTLDKIGAFVFININNKLRNPDFVPPKMPTRIDLIEKQISAASKN